MTISQVELANTFDVWRVRTNQLITVSNDLTEGNLLTTGTITIDNTNAYQNNVGLNVRSGMIYGDAGLLSNVGAPASITNHKLQNSSVKIEVTQNQLILSSNTISLGSAVYLNVTNLVTSTSDTSTANIPSANVVNTVHRMAVFANGLALFAADQANVARTQANAAFEQSNTANNLANTAYQLFVPLVAAVALVDSNSAASFAQANIARDHANSSYATANSKFSSSGGTITGNVTVVGDLSVTGNTYFINSSTLNIADPLIYLAANNYVSDVVDIGIIANYLNSSSINVHTGVYRDATTKEWYVFQEYSSPPINNHINPAGNNFTLAVLNADIRTSNLRLGGVNALSTLVSAYNHANGGFTNANSAFNKANTANITADLGFTHANTAYAHANAAFAFANSGASTVAIGAFNKANAVSTNAVSAKIGTAGDIPGQIAISNNFIYFSMNTYSGSANVWKSIPLAGDFGQEAPYVMLPYFYGTPSLANAHIFMSTTIIPFYLPAGLTGSNVRSRVAASGTTAVLTMYKNSTNIGVINFAQTSNIATFTFSSSQEFVPGDVFTIINNPAPDAGLADIAFSILGYRR